MNAAARLAHQNILSRYLVLTHLLSRTQIAAMVLSFTVIFSALGIVYVTHVSRMLYAHYQQNLIEQDHLQVQYGQLLLERSTWMMQTRIQHIAEHKLGMIIPEQKSVVIVHE